MATYLAVIGYGERQVIAIVGPVGIKTGKVGKWVLRVRTGY